MSILSMRCSRRSCAVAQSGRSNTHKILIKLFLLNIAASYRHVVKAATEDKGHTDEPDHLASVLKFMAFSHT